MPGAPGEMEELQAQLSTAEKAAAEAWDEYKVAAPPAQEVFLERYRDIQGGVDCLREQIKQILSYGASKCPLQSLGPFFVCQLAAAAAAFFRSARLRTRRSP